MAEKKNSFEEGEEGRKKRKTKKNSVPKSFKRTGKPKQGRYRNSGGGRKFPGII